LADAKGVTDALLGETVCPAQIAQRHFFRD
jgi:hypothetical protein